MRRIMLLVTVALMMSVVGASGAFAHTKNYGCGNKDLWGVYPGEFNDSNYDGRVCGSFRGGNYVYTDNHIHR